MDDHATRLNRQNLRQVLAHIHGCRTLTDLCCDGCATEADRLVSKLSRQPAPA